MCPPKYYGVYYEINPWMSVANPADIDVARRQWNNLHDLYRSLGVEVELLEPVEGLPDMVFTANAGLIDGNRCVVSNFRHQQRKGEEPYFKKWFQEHGFEILELPPEYHFEGAGDAKCYQDVLFAGFHFRSDARSHTVISHFLQRRVIPLELVDEKFYHLDTCFAPLARSLVMYYPPAFARYSRRAIQHYVTDLLPVDKEDALGFACNCVVVDDKVIVNWASPALRAELATRGFEVLEVDVSEFMKAGGGTGCLTLVLEP
jgi:N-dimethylarginine dimethylaminohydrolase